MGTVKTKTRKAATFLAAVLLAVAPAAAVGDTELRDLAEMSIEDLFNSYITSVSKRAENQFKAAAAVYVITGEDIRRSGATSLPEALRMAPGLHVARMNANHWAVSARGFNGRFANKLLVLVDGRSIYNHLFSGVWWELQDVVLEDVERIEVIRGPGAAIWGSNAVNGVINIITRSATDSDGGLASVSVDTDDSVIGAARVAAPAGEKGAVRAYGRVRQGGRSRQPTGSVSHDGSRFGLAGVRADWSDGKTEATLETRGAGGRIEEHVFQPVETFPYVSGSRDTVEAATAFVRGAWQRQTSDGLFSVNAYYDFVKRTSAQVDLRSHIFDVEVRHRKQVTGRHELTWGASFRDATDATAGTRVLSFMAEFDRLRLLSLFAQDHFQVVPDRLSIVAGGKVERQSFSGWEIQPNIRVGWTPNDSRTLWASASRAVRTPSRADLGVALIDQILPPGALGPNTPMAFAVATGNPSFQSEVVNALEAGYRTIPQENLTFDVSVFYNAYRNLRSTRTLSPTVSDDLRLIVPIELWNDDEASAWGVETMAELRPASNWRVQGFYTYHNVDYRERQGSLFVANTPTHQGFVRSTFDLGTAWEVDVTARFVDAVEDRSVDRYVHTDVRVGWFPRPDLEIAVWGRGLQPDRNLEYSSEFISVQSGAAPRSVGGKVTWRF